MTCAWCDLPPSNPPSLSPSLSRSVTLFYSAGITVGVVASLLILLYVFSKFVPKVRFEQVVCQPHCVMMLFSEEPRGAGCPGRWLHPVCLLLLLAVDSCPGGRWPLVYVV